MKKRSRVRLGICLLFLLLAIDSFHHAKVYYFFANIAGKSWIAPYCDKKLHAFFPMDNRFWLHGCNTIQKLQTIGSHYAGVELDIIYYANIDTFGVSHESEDIISLPLEESIAYLADTDQMIWLDFKNLTEQTKLSSRSCLDSLLARHHIDKSRIIVESNEPSALEYFTENGFYTSYYCPVNDKTTFASTQTEKEYTDNIRQISQSKNICALSCAANYFPLVKEAAPQMELLTWERNDDKWWGFYLLPSLRTILNDKNVKAILVYDTIHE